MSSLLKVEGLHMSFQGREVVHGVSFEIKAGEKLALVGESGSGKTVTALSLLGLARGAWVRGKAVFEDADLLGVYATQAQVYGEAVGRGLWVVDGCPVGIVQSASAKFEAVA